MAYVDTEFEEPERIMFAKLESIGDSIEGIFAGTEERKNNFGKTEVHARIKTGESEDGEAIIESLRTNQRLLAQVASIKRGARIRIEYVDDRENEGVDRQGNALKPTKLFRVQVDDGKIPVQVQAPAQGLGGIPREDDIPF